jgi:lipopolysaccharide/colanic/teichoic acid biosynthesis glycosyltransferase
MPEPITLIGFAGGLAAVAGHLARRYFECAKEIVDILLGVLALVITLPIWVVCAILIKVSSRGPVLFTQVRAGKEGRLFRMYKFRTMHVSAENETGAVWACGNDPRVIGLCRWMRKSHADELPQLINVIKGDMSLVGPRPERPEILEQLETHYPDVKKRLAVMPGITGLAQIRNGYDTSVEDFRHKLESDLEYINKRRWRNELRILAATLTKIHDKKAH